MKHRGVASQTGLGGNAEVLISGKNTSDVPDELLKQVLNDCYAVFNFETFGYCEIGFDGDECRVGIEPSYQFEPLKIIIIAKNKEDSRIVTGRAVGAWAAAIRSTTKEYRHYAYKSKFVKFVDKWHEVIFKD